MRWAADSAAESTGHRRTQHIQVCYLFVVTGITVVLPIFEHCQDMLLYYVSVYISFGMSSFGISYTLDYFIQFFFGIFLISKIYTI